MSVWKDIYKYFRKGSKGGEIEDRKKKIKSEINSDPELKDIETPVPTPSQEKTASKAPDVLGMVDIDDDEPAVRLRRPGKSSTRIRLPRETSKRG